MPSIRRARTRRIKTRRTTDRRSSSLGFSLCLEVGLVSFVRTPPSLSFVTNLEVFNPISFSCFLYVYLCSVGFAMNLFCSALLPWVRSLLHGKPESIVRLYFVYRTKVLLFGSESLCQSPSFVYQVYCPARPIFQSWCLASNSKSYPTNSKFPELVAGTELQVLSS